MDGSGELEQRLMACRLESEAAKIMESWLGLSGERLHEFVPSVLRALPESWLSYKQIMIWQDWCIGSLSMIKMACELPLQEFLLLCERDPFYAAFYYHFPERDYQEVERLALRFQVNKTPKKKPGKRPIVSAKRRSNELNTDSHRKFKTPDSFVRYSARRQMLGRSQYDGLDARQRFRREALGLPELTDEYVALHLPFVRESEEHAHALFCACIREVFPRAWRWTRRWDVQRLGFSVEELVQEACASIWCAIPSWPLDGDAASVRELVRDAIFSGIDQALQDAGISIKRGRTSVIPDASLDDPIGYDGETVRRNLMADPVTRPPDAILDDYESELRNELVRMRIKQKFSSLLTPLELAVIFQKFGFETEWDREEILGHWQITEEDFGLVEAWALEIVRGDNEIVAALRQIAQGRRESSFGDRSYTTGRGSRKTR